jgi:hypothetical protein
MKVSWTWAVLAVVGETPGLQPISFEGREMFMEADPFLGDPEIAAVDPVRRGYGVILHVHLTAEGVEELISIPAASADQAELIIERVRARWPVQ